MTRTHVEPIHVRDLRTTTISRWDFAGAEARVLSEDDDSGAFTALVTLAPGTTHRVGRQGRAVEILVLSGRCLAGGQEVGPGTYVHVFGGSRELPLASVADDAEILLMVDESETAQDAAPAVVDTNAMTLADPGVPGVPPGLAIKLLHVDDARGDWTWIGSCAPDWREERTETHPTVEEAFCLRGDMFLAGRGQMLAGGYFWRPAHVAHGPMYTRDGSIFFFRTKGGPMEVAYEDCAEWPEMLAAYRSNGGFYVPAEAAAWAT